MARLVIHSATSPKKIAGKDGDVFICMCGLSTNKPFCSGAHKTIKEEAKDELLAYDEDGSVLKFEGGHEHDEGCCSGDCEHGCECDHDEKGHAQKKKTEDDASCCGHCCCDDC